MGCFGGLHDKNYLSAIVEVLCAAYNKLPADLKRRAP
jgi:hypothetical protein